MPIVCVGVASSRVRLPNQASFRSLVAVASLVFRLQRARSIMMSMIELSPVRLVLASAAVFLFAD